MLQNNKIYEINANSEITPELFQQLKESLKAQGIIIEKKSPSKKLGKLQIIDMNTAHCCGCNNEFNINSISADIELEFARKHGLCPTCTHKVLEAREIMKRVKLNDTNYTPNKSARSYVIEFIEHSTFTANAIKLLCDTEFCKKHLGLQYALLRPYNKNMDINEQIKYGNFIKYSKKPIKINRHNYLMTIAIYHDNLSQIKATFRNLGILPENF